MKITHEFQFQIGDVVYSVTDREQCEMFVTGYKIRPNNHISYFVSCNGMESIFYDFELSKTKNILKGLN